jgi:hypothetical protein
VGQVLETASLNDIVPIRADADSAVAVAST